MIADTYTSLNKSSAGDPFWPTAAQLIIQHCLDALRFTKAPVTIPRAQFRANLLPEEFPQLFAQPVYRETLSGREEELNDRLGGDLPHPFSLWSNLAHGKGSYGWSRRFATTVRSRSESTCV